MKLPYLKKYRSLDGITVYIVDGGYIRKNLNSEFTNFGQHYRFPNMIPRNEFWLDDLHGKQEYECFIAHMKAENEAMKRGLDYHDALKLGNKESLEYRDKHDGKSEYKRLLKKIGEIEIWLVDGKVVRDKYYLNFVQGGHDLVYDWIPKNQIWIDDKVRKEERDDIAWHEFYERDKMRDKIPYLSAHAGASRVEKEYRRGRKPPRRFKGIVAIIKGIK